jgi:hypothetical protein
VNPRDLKTVLPQWAQAKSHYWEPKFRNPTEMSALKLGIIDSPARLRSRLEFAARLR